MSIESLEEMLKKVNPPRPQYAGIPLSPEETAKQQYKGVTDDTPKNYTPQIPVSRVIESKQGNPTRVESQDINVAGDVAEMPQRFTNEPKNIFPSKYADVLLPQDEGEGTPVPLDGRVGGTPPDFSALEKLKEELGGKKPKDTSWIDLLGMAIPTLVGASVGQLGAGAVPAGEYGIQRGKETEKREQSLEDMITKLDYQMALQKAKGTKGEKLSATAGGVRARLWEDDEGNQRLAQKIGPEGTWLRGKKDPVYKSARIQYRDEKRPEGDIVQVATRANLKTPVGAFNPSQKTITDAEGRTKAFNPRGMGTGAVQSIGKEFEQTGMGLSPKDEKDYENVSSKAMQDPILRGLEGSYNDIVTGTTALGRGDVGSMKLAVKSLASALEKGRVVSDRDYEQVANMNLGLLQSFNQKIERAKSGQELNSIRQEIASAFSILNESTKVAYERRAQRFDQELQRRIGTDKGLKVQRLPDFSGKQQRELVLESAKTSQGLMSEKEFEGRAVDPRTGEEGIYKMIRSGDKVIPIMRVR
jgi:hypothetical protein